jgi:tetratricopeptide (TPR) repeat protein
VLRIKVWLLGLALAAGLASPTFATPWLRAESPHFIVYGDSGEKRLRDYNLMLEDFDGLLRAILMPGAAERPAAKLTVYLLDNHSQFDLAAPGLGDQVDGVYMAGTDQIFAVAIRGAIDQDRNRGDDTVLHEYTHHFFKQNFPGGYPAWLTEGYAEYFATADLSAKIKVGDWNRGRALTLLLDQWLPSADLVSKGVFELPDDRRGAFYAEAWLLTHYIVSDSARAATMAGYLRGLEHGADPRTTWVAAFGDSKTLDKALREYMTKPMRGSLWNRNWQLPQIQVTPVPAAAGSVLLARRALDQERKAETIQRALKTIREAAAKYPDDDIVQTTKAIADSRYGDRDAANAALDKLIAKDGQNVEALRARAINRVLAADSDNVTSEQREADLRGASRLLGLAAKVEPDSYQTLYWYVRSRQFENGFPNQNTYNAMLRAADLAPQVDELRMAAADLAMRRDDVATAREMLIPVASDPHGGEGAKAAKRRLDDIDARTEPRTAKGPDAMASPARPGS